jgi:hypothetical protein
LDSFKFDFLFDIFVSVLKQLTLWLYSQGLTRFCSWRHNLLAGEP